MKYIGHLKNEMSFFQVETFRHDRVAISHYVIRERRGAMMSTSVVYTDNCKWF